MFSFVLNLFGKTILIFSCYITDCLIAISKLLFIDGAFFLQFISSVLIALFQGSLGHFLKSFHFQFLHNNSISYRYTAI